MTTMTETIEAFGTPANTRVASGVAVAALLAAMIGMVTLAAVNQMTAISNGFNAWVPTLLAEHGFSIVRSLEQFSAMQNGAVPGAWIAAAISDRWERKILITIVALSVAACGMIYGLSFNTWTIVIFGFLVAMGQQIFAPLLYTYTPESFPTEARNTAAGVSYGIGRLGNAFGPLIVAYLFTRYGYSTK